MGRHTRKREIIIEKDSYKSPSWAHRIRDVSAIISLASGLGVVIGVVVMLWGLPDRIRAIEESLAKINSGLDQSKSEIKEGYYSAKITEEREKARDERINELKERIRECCPYRRIDDLLDKAVGRKRR